MTQRRAQWPVVAVNGAVAATVLVLVAVLALVVNPPAPPGISAFAPQAAKPITKAPQNQSAQFGNGAGACVAGQVCAGPTPTPSPAGPVPPASTRALAVPTDLGVPSALQCFTWPDGTVTQTFDPQSPPCIASWDDRKGNGGSTAPGVTATEVRLAFPNDGAGFATWPGLQPLVDFFNSHFQLYGRKIRVVPFTSQQATDQQDGNGQNTPGEQRADAAQVSQLKVFAAIDFIDPTDASWSLPAYRDELARHKVISISGGGLSPYGSAGDLKAPYEWTYYPTLDAVFGSTVKAVCRQLAGKPAAHAGQASLRTKTRKFAVVLPEDQDLGGPMPGLAAALQVLDSCGVHNPPLFRYHPSQSPTENYAAYAAKLRQFESDGVTSLIYLPFHGIGAANAPPGVAGSIGYAPEWVHIGWNAFFSAAMMGQPASETNAAFGVGAWNKQLPVGQEMWRQAWMATGGTPGAQSDAPAFYNELLLLASGIQLAGPDLTPASFARGLQTTTFPNPGAGGAPFYQGTVGFSDDTTMVDDFHEFWLDTRTTNSEVTTAQNLNTYRAFCLVGLGRRSFADSWVASDGFYRGGCR